MEHTVHGPVGDLGGPLVPEQVEGHEWQALEFRPPAGRSQVFRQPVTQCRDSRAGAGAGVVPAEELPQLPTKSEERADESGRALRWIARGERLDEQVEVVRAARSRERPDILHLEVPGDLVDPPRARGVS